MGSSRCRLTHPQGEIVGPLRSARVTRLHRSYEPLRHRRRPNLSLTGCSLAAFWPPSPSASRAFCAFLRYMPSSIPRRTCKVRLSLASLAALAFSVYTADRRPLQTFRGLIERSLALRPASSRNHIMILSIEGSDDFIASIAASIATGQAILPRRDFHPLKHTNIHGARIQQFTTQFIEGVGRPSALRGWGASRGRAPSRLPFATL